jgi:hypothetical protein
LIAASTTSPAYYVQKAVELLHGLEEPAVLDREVAAMLT